jgi:uracil-DNA glycosylase
MAELSKFLNDVYRCHLCPEIFGFRSPAGQNQPYYKFPPLIGASSHAKILFVGINPRVSNTNRKLHDRLIESEESFSKLAQNRLDDGTPYISLNAEEEHYHSHMLIVEGVFGSQCEFEKEAAVTELYLCASESAPRKTLEVKSVCAEQHLKTSLNIINPKVIIAVGTTVRNHLRQHFNELIKSVPVVKMVHPRFLFGLSLAEKKRRLQPTINTARRIVG